eukprot:GHVL01013993.1.p1 GENE.GHVL01013993.1~~GHVL01013993.1.p1  ORF type:complete len:1057 (-),score=171.17 GHVL01013993.1:225-3395(-)
MAFMGNHFERTTGSKTDPRVMFKPDGWQRKILDFIDEGHSSLVVAPTASGKTFIGYYAMEKILRMDNTSMVVYVAPSESMLNQVAAECWARFKNKHYEDPKKRLIGEFSSKVTSYLTDCQILITIPSRLEMLLMSPYYTHIVDRIGYVIFDEVHCIGEDGGSVWERVVQLITAPFLAFSATIGNPESFHEWLVRVSDGFYTEKGKKRQCHLIKYEERFSDLPKYRYINGEIYPLHPFCCLNYHQFVRSGIVGDFYMLPRESLLLFKILSTKRNVSWLDPKEYFFYSRLITKRQYRYYEKSLQIAFLDMIQNGEMSEGTFKEITDELITSPVLEMNGDEFDLNDIGCIQIENDAVDEFKKKKQSTKSFKQITPTSASTATSTNQVSELTQRTRLDSENTSSISSPQAFEKMVDDLNARGWLPAIFFNLERDSINKMAKSFVEYRMKRQWERFYGTDDAAYKTKLINKQRLEKWESKKRQIETNEKLKKNDPNYDETIGDGIEEAPLDIAEEFNEDTTYASLAVWNNYRREIEEYLRKVKMVLEESDLWLLQGLKLGIGIHHEGHHKKFRQYVEILFRLGFLRVIVCTSTLALGINMPCKSVIFTDSHMKLTPTLFRQMSGRAGRRGQDLIGRVIFVNFTFRKIQLLLASGLHVFQGHYPLTTGLTLRSLALTQLIPDFTTDDVKKLFVTKEEPVALRERIRKKMKSALIRMFTEPLLTVSTENHILKKEEMKAIQNELKFNFRFNVDLLAKLFMVSKNGSLQLLAGLPFYLYEKEPAIFLFAFLILEGIFDDPHMATDEFMLIIANIFNRKLLTRSIQYRAKKKFDDATEDHPILQPPREDVQKCISQYNQIVMETFNDCIKICALSTELTSNDYQLPASKIFWKRQSIGDQSECISLVPETDASRVNDESSWMKALGNSNVPSISRSPFSALSGNGDLFGTAEEIEREVRRHIQIDQVPLVPVQNTIPAEMEEFCNSFILDFLIHGKLNLMHRNFMSQADAWTSINDFVLILKHLTTVVTNMNPSQDTNYLENIIKKAANNLETARRAVDATRRRD